MKEEIIYLDENRNIVTKENAKYFIHREEYSDGRFNETFGELNVSNNKDNVDTKYVDESGNEVEKEKATFVLIQEISDGIVIKESKFKVNN